MSSARHLGRVGFLCLTLFQLAFFGSAKPESPIAAARFKISINGADAGFIPMAVGGTLVGDVVGVDEGGVTTKKHLATISHEPLSMTLDLNQGMAIYDWIADFLEVGDSARNLDLTAVEVDMGAQTRRCFFDAHITSISFPALDGSSKDPAYMTVKINPERIDYLPARPIRAPGEKVGKKFLASNFRIELGDLPATRVTKIDSFTIKQAVGSDGVRVPGRLEFPNLTFNLPTADLGPWENWFESFVIQGQSSDSDELNGSIELLSPDLNEVLGTVELSQCGIFSLRHGGETTKKKSQEFQVEIYCEGMGFRVLP